MTQTDISIVHLEPMRVASTYGFGTNPEEIAWQALVEWATPKGFLEDITLHPIFGMNNPYPTPATPRYGYEFWIKVGVEIEPEGNIRIEEFFGGSYAVSRCEARGHPEINIPHGWQMLARWCEEHGYRPGQHRALERFLTPPGTPASLVMDLYCPIITQVN